MIFFYLTIRSVICVYINFRSDAESISTSVSQDSNKENHTSTPSPSESTVAGEEETVILRRKTDSKVNLF